MAQPHVLIVEDDPIMAERCTLDLADCTCTTAGSGAAALAALDRRPVELMILDIRLPDGNGLDVLRQVRARGLPVAVVVATSHGSVNLAVEAMQAGADDFLVKPFTSDRLRVTVRNLLERQRLARTVEELASELDPRPGGGLAGFVGVSPVMRGVYRTIKAAAPSRATVFITGESGTGKELCAEAIHRLSPRRKGPFVAINCAAIPADLMESELFGHVKGAFTGAVGHRDGAAARADGGTLFLDEICEMDLALQSKLLRFLQTGAIQKVGGGGPVKVDIRVVCATNRDPLAEVEAGRFREDLYYRLHVIPITLPPLRDRLGDALEIAQVLLVRLAGEEGKGFTSLGPDAAAAIAAYDWPGNVRQLENVLRNAVVLNDGPVLSAAMLPPPLNRPGGGGAGLPVSLPPATVSPTMASQAMTSQAVRPLWQVERDAIEQAIALCGGNVPRAAALLEISPSTIYRKRIAWDRACDPAWERNSS